MLPTYQGYLQDGKFISQDNLPLPNNKKVILTILDDETAPTKKVILDRQRQAVDEFVAANRQVKDEPAGEEFDEILSKRLHFRQFLSVMNQRAERIANGEGVTISTDELAKMETMNGDEIREFIKKVQGITV